MQLKKLMGLKSSCDLKTHATQKLMQLENSCNSKTYATHATQKCIQHKKNHKTQSSHATYTLHRVA